MSRDETKWQTAALQVGTRAQSERIRTYNFSQDRVTDHRTGYSTRDIKVTSPQRWSGFQLNHTQCDSASVFSSRSS